MDTKQLMEWSAKYHTPNYGRTPLDWAVVKGFEDLAMLLT